jgi:NADH-quinone oxidoreductase subunit L
VIWGSSWAGWVLLLTAGLTAYYTFRVFFRVFVGPTLYEPGDDHHGDDGHHDAEAEAFAHAEEDAHGHGGFHPHAPGWAMNLVLVLLAGGSVLAAGLYFVNKDDHGWTGSMVHQSSAYVHGATWASHGKDKDMVSGAGDTVDPVAGAGDHVGHGVPIALTAGGHTEHGTIFGFDPHKAMYYVSAVFGFVGIGAAAYFHLVGRTRSDEVRMDAVSNAIRPVSTWAEEKWLVDELYQLVIVMPLRVISHLFHWFDKLVIDTVLVNGTAKLPGALASALRTTQSGLLNGYALRMIGGVAIAVVVAALMAL